MAGRHGQSKRLLALLRRMGTSDLPTLDISKIVQSALNKRTKTRDEKTVLWHGGGGFKHFQVGIECSSLPRFRNHQ